MKNNIIALKEFRNNVEAYSRRVDKGESFIVVKRSKPIFKITPVDEEEGWETIADFTKIRKGGVDFKEILAALNKMK